MVCYKENILNVFLLVKILHWTFRKYLHKNLSENNETFPFFNDLKCKHLKGDPIYLLNIYFGSNNLLFSETQKLVQLKLTVFIQIISFSLSLLPSAKTSTTIIYDHRFYETLHNLTFYFCLLYTFS